MIAKLKTAVNAAISPLGVEANRRGMAARLSDLLSQSRGKLVSAAGELEGLARSTVFPGLREREGRPELMAQLIGTSLCEALHIVSFLGGTLDLPGDICEFGIAQGATSALIANEIRDTDKKLWLFDSFEGLPRPTEKDRLIDDIFSLGSMERYQGTMACGQDQVVGRLNSIGFPLDRANIVAGFIEKTVKYAGIPTSVCFAYVDFDFYEPIKIALELLHKRLPLGGVVIVDDYGFFSEGAQAAVDEFVELREGQYKKEPSPEWAGKFCVVTRIA